MAEKKKILHIVEAMGGGVFTYIVELANGLSKDFDVTIAYGVRKETPKNFAEYFGENVKLIRVNSFRRRLNLKADFKACLEVRKIVKEVAPDIIHMHSSKAGAVGRLALGSKRRQLYYTPHGYSFLMEGVCSSKKWMYRKIEQIFGKKNCLTVACGKSEWEVSRQVTKKSTYISNGVNTEKMDRLLVESRPAEDKNHRFTVYTTGRVSYQKGPEVFAEIAKLLPQVQFVWIGDGSMRDVLNCPNITVTGWKTPEETIKIAQNGDVFLLTSRWEGLPISLLEAMYMKKPCIASNIVGNRDVVIDGVTGYFCDSAQEYAKVIRMLQEKIEGKEDIGQRAETKEGDAAWQERTKASCETMVEAAYQEIVREHNIREFCRRYKALYLGEE